MNNTVKIVGIAVLSSIVTIGSYHLLGLQGNNVIFNEASKPSLNRLANYDGPAGVPGDFTYAAELSTPSVVHIKAKSSRSAPQQRSVFDDFFGGESPFGQPRGNQQQESSGSGVFISADGYIATNNHVIEGATELEVVTSDHKSFTAKVIGTDPSTDIAVIKIEGKHPAMSFANSDNVKVGEWVLAVGNPFNLESTVTAGIVSAKGRNIGILAEKQQQQMYRRYGEDGRQAKANDAIESFIQTDAAVNPGNSGGALVNLKGELIGINTAIASPNGAYAGYAFAVPSEIVKKVTADIVKYGNVQRGYLGINLVELDSKKAEEFNTKTDEGIYVADVLEKGAAQAAGIQKGDVIVKIDGMATKSGPKLQEIIGRKRPGEVTKVTVNRNGSLKDYDVTLRNRDGGKDIVKNTIVSENKVFEQLGIELTELSSADKQKMGLQNGVLVKKIFEGTIADYTQMREGFVVMKVGEKRINSASDFKAAIKEVKESGEEGVMICGTYQSSSRTTCYGLSLE